MARARLFAPKNLLGGKVATKRTPAKSLRLASDTEQRDASNGRAVFRGGTQTQIGARYRPSAPRLAELDDDR
jgi:hypothetical protein